MKYINKLDVAPFHIKFNIVATIVWLVLLGPTILYWRDSIAYVVFMSWYAIFVGHISAWLAAKAERNTT